MNKHLAEDILKECVQVRQSLDLIDEQLKMIVDAINGIDEAKLKKLFDVQKDTKKSLQMIHHFLVNIGKCWYQLKFGDRGVESLSDFIKTHLDWTSHFENKVRSIFAR